MELSLCMIVRNEEAVLARCLACVLDVVDEIIIVDTGSTDRTKEVAWSYTHLIYDFPWIDDFAAARNYAFSKATKPYIMWLDADDVITPEGAQALKKLKETMQPDVDMVMMPYHVSFDSQENPTFTYERERIIRRAAGYAWVGAIHEVIPPAGRIIHAQIPVLHKKIGPGEPDRNLRIFDKMIAKGKALCPREQYYYARELMFHRRWSEAIERFERYMEEGQGWLENVLSACRDLADCYMALGEKQKALNTLLKSFIYDAPRAETCCQIGKHFFEEGSYRTAAFWYELAANNMLPRPTGGFIMPDSYDYIPYMQLCVCYHKLNDLQKSMEYNNLAGKLKPDDPSYLYNKAFFDSLVVEKENTDQ